MLVETIMTAPVTTISPDDTILATIDLVREKRIRHLPVIDGGKLSGIVTDRDLRPNDGTTVKEVMTAPVHFVHPLDSVAEVARLMYEYKIGCLPVVRGAEVIGIVTETDILRSFVELLGFNKPGSHLEVEMPDRPGMLAVIADIIKEHGVNITSVYTSQAENQGRKVLVFRIQTIDLRAIVADIIKAGYRVLWPLPKDEDLGK
ncbi:MAG: CBS and ACT domain-containing protein [Clostridia bacterium]|nr:CBS and ACT domain-containing protein [Clostridia bacterium]